MTSLLQYMPLKETIISWSFWIAKDQSSNSLLQLSEIQYYSNYLYQKMSNVKVRLLIESLDANTWEESEGSEDV